MSAYNPAVLILALEGVVVMALLSGMLLYLGMRKNRSDRAGATRLVGRIKKDEDARREKLAGIFKSCYGVDDNEINDRVEEFVTREKAFYKTLIALYLNRDSSKLAKFTDELDEVIGPCLELAARKPNGGSEADMQELREQNDMLERELQSTRRVMETLMAEYNAAFNKEASAVKTEASEEPEEGADQPQETGETVELEDEKQKAPAEGAVAKLLKSGKKRQPAADDEADAEQSAAAEQAPAESEHTQDDAGTAVTDKDIDRIMEAIDAGEEGGAQAETPRAANQG